MAWLSVHHPRLLSRYKALYADGAYAPTWYQRRITRQVHEFATEYGIGPSRRPLRQAPPPQAEPAAAEPTEPTQLMLQV
jgi:hypothetical protein